MIGVHRYSTAEVKKYCRGSGSEKLSPSELVSRAQGHIIYFKAT